jgi:hypothetical protein
MAFLQSRDTSELEKYETTSRIGTRSAGRRLATWIIEHHAFQATMCVILLMNLALLCYGSDRMAICDRAERDGHACSLSLYIWGNNAFLVVYIIELILRMYACGSEFFRVGVKWNVIDVVIVLLAGVHAIRFTAFNNAGTQLVGIARMVRFGRFLSVFEAFPTLYLMLRGLAGIVSTMLWGSALMGLLLVMWSVLAMHSVRTVISDHGDVLGLDPYCKEAFSSIFETAMYFFKTILAGDSWGLCASPIIAHAPWTFFIFGGSVLTVTFGAANLILSVIVEKSVEAREADSHAVILRKRQEKIEFANTMYSVLEKADSDGSGTLTLDELVRGYEGDATLRNEFNKMDIDRTDLRNLFYLLGADEHVGLSYTELISLLQKARLQDMRVYLMTMRLQIEQIAAMMHGCYLSRSGEHDVHGQSSSSGAWRDQAVRHVSTRSSSKSVKFASESTGASADSTSDDASGSGSLPSEPASAFPQRLATNPQTDASAEACGAAEDEATFADQLPISDIKELQAVVSDHTCPVPAAAASSSQIPQPEHYAFPGLPHRRREEPLELAGTLGRSDRLAWVRHVFPLVARSPDDLSSSSSLASKLSRDCASNSIV